MDSGIRVRLEVEDDAGTRLDKWLTEALQDADYEVSRSQVQTFLKEGYISGPRDKLRPSDAVEAGDVYAIAVPASQPVSLLGEDLPVDVVYEDDDLVVVNKARGMVVHPAAGHSSHTLVHGLIGRQISLSAMGGEFRPGVVHRIDKDTSGLLVLAKTDTAYAGLAEQIRQHSMHRHYEAICHGVLTHDEGTVDAPVGRDSQNRQRMAVTQSGKSAVTHFHVLERFQRYCHLQLRLETGRTHQIRVHMAYIHHPVAGDPVYGPRHTLPISGQALHARSLGFVHPVTGRELLFEAPLPEDMDTLLAGLRKGLW